MIPAATYRIQFREEMTFDNVVELVPYLRQLGISHVYASPIFTAAKDSTHGYDIINPLEIDPVIGGRDGFDRMVDALQKAGMGVILDIVPNHMSTSLENAWWHDVIENGKDSRYAGYFDIDWSRPLTLPFLGDTFEAELENGNLTLGRDETTGKPVFSYFDCRYPLNPNTWAGKEDEILELDSAGIAALHQAQSWRLMSWREAPRQLSWRRFFEITGLVGVKVEDQQVFDETHALILELVRSHRVDGLRIDHVDGLADPLGYLQRLREATGPDCYITVEKILGRGEQLPESWPVSGTTGYEFIASLAEVMVDDDNIGVLEALHDKVTGITEDKRDVLRDAKELMVDRNFEGEFTTLRQLAAGVASSGETPVSSDALHHVLRELLIAFPLYRTYGTDEGLPAADSALVDHVIKQTGAATDPATAAAAELLVKILNGQVTEANRGLATQFRTRFQQLTGPLMAKSVEDTLFFRHNVDLALNEVGASPTPRAFSLARFHQEMRIRLTRQPDALLGTSTHDTKRGEDARARLYTLTEAPEQWAENLASWRQLNRASVQSLDDGAAPNAADSWMLYQALAGVWPPELSPEDACGLKSLEERFIPFVEKALREAKQRTDWIDSNEPYENAVINYAKNLLSPDNTAFLQQFCQDLKPFIHAGLMNSLSQTVIKLTAPGVPDIYQGTESLNFSLVDPDNRRQPDYAVLEQNLLSASRDVFTDAAAWRDGRVKQYVTTTLLQLRVQHPDLFRYGEWVPLKTEGERADKIIAWARIWHDDVLVVAVPRLVFDDVADELPTDSRRLWRNTHIVIPEALAGRRYRDVFSNDSCGPEASLALDALEGCLLVLVGIAHT